MLTRRKPTYASLLRYIFNKASTQLQLTHNLRGETLEEWVKEFKENENFRKQKRSDQVFLFHEILSFSNQDTANLTPEILKDISGEYIRLRGIQGMYAGAVHTDKDHIHLHFCVSPLEFRTGKAFRLSPKQLKGLKIALQDYHKAKYPQLEHSIVNHGKGISYTTDKEWYARERTGRTFIKADIRTYVRSCFERSQTIHEFTESLRNAGMHHYERKGLPVGILYQGIKFRFTRLGISREEIEHLTRQLPREQLKKVVKETEIDYDR